MKKTKNVIAVLLSLSMLINTVPNGMVSALSGDAVSSDTSTDTAITQNSSDIKPYILGELTDKRTENTKQFRMSDGTILAAQYNGSVHYQDAGGNWQDIDNTLADSNVSANAAVSASTDEKKASLKERIATGYENQDNTFNVRFAKNAQSGQLVRIQNDGYQISWRLAGVNLTKAKSARIVNSATAEKPAEATTKSAAATAAAADTSVPSLADVKTLVQTASKEKATAAQKKAANEAVEKRNDDILSLKKVSSRCTYEDVFPGVDLEYVINSQGVKENIVLKNKDAQSTFTFHYQLDGLEMRKAEDGSIEVYDPAKSDEVKYNIPAPYMYDSSEDMATSEDVSLDVIEKDGIYTVTLTASENWIGSAERVYPVTVDPELETAANRWGIHETYVSQNDPNSNKTNESVLKVGRGYSTGVHRTYLYFDLPSIPASSRIVAATLSLCPDPTQWQNMNDITPGLIIEAHDPARPIDTGSMTWNTPTQTYDPTIIDYQNVDTYRWYQWDVTKLAVQWYSGKNYGVMLKYNDESTSVRFAAGFYSSDHTTENVYPTISMRYTDTKGLEDYWTTESNDIGRAGTGYIKHAQGDLTFVHDDIGVSGNRLPVAISHIYNSSDKDVNIGYGNGWRTNYNQKVTGPHTYSGDTKQYYEYTDADGTVHYYTDNGSGKITDEDDPSSILTINSSSDEARFVITDKNENKLEFLYWGDLRRIKDANQNVILINYTTICGKPMVANIWDGGGRAYVYNYDSNANLTSIDYIGTGGPAIKTVGFYYTNGKLTRIKDPDGVSSFYSYYSNNLLATAQNNDGQELHYTYSNGILPKVSKVQQYNTNGVMGDETSFDYSVNTTKVSGFPGVFGKNDPRNGVDFIDANPPDHSGITKAICLKAGTNTPIINSHSISLLTNKNYMVEFDYWADADNTAFITDLYPDDLPERTFIAQKALQHASWTFSSTSSNMTNASYRFFYPGTLGANVYITNLKISESGNSNFIDLTANMQSGGVSIDQNVYTPFTGGYTNAIRLQAGIYVPWIDVKQYCLKTGTDYTLEFDCRSDAANIQFGTDLYPDSLPQQYFTAQTGWQHVSWTLRSDSPDISSGYLRFFSDSYGINPANVYIANVKFYESSNSSTRNYIRNGVLQTANIYHFNTFGNTIDVMDEDGNAQYYTFGTSGGEKGKVTLASKEQHPVVNLLMNGNAETDGYFTNAVWDVSNDGSFSFDTAEHYSGSRSLKIVSGSDSDTRRLSYQTVYLTAGKTYTLSAYVKAANVTSSKGGSPGLFVLANDFSEYFETSFGNTSSWVQKSLTFTPTKTINYTICADIVNAAGTAWFDCMQLEESASANRYNLVENAGMEYGSGSTPNFWSPGGTDATDGVVSNGLNGSRSFTINGNASTTKNISQTIPITGGIGNSFVISGFAKANAAVVTGGRQVHLFVIFRSSVSGVPDQYNSFGFNTATNDWQYLSSAVVSNIAYNAVTIVAVYAKEVNSISFDNIQLYQEQFGQTYDYDGNGNVTSVKELASQNSTLSSQFNYSNNELVQALNPTGESYNYTYDETNPHKLLAATSGGVTSRFTYDSYGNPLTTHTESAGIVSGNAYYIRVACNNYALDVHTAQDADGLLIQQLLFNGTNAQKWTFTLQSNGRYIISPACAPSRVLEVTNGQDYDGAEITIRTRVAGAARQEWEIIRNSDGSYRLRPGTSSTRYLDVGGPNPIYNTATKAHLYVSVSNNSNNQSFFFEPVGTATNSPYLTSSAAYTSDGNYMASMTDARGKTTTSNYDLSKGTLLSTTQTDGISNYTTNYTYDDKNDRLTSVSAAVGGNTVTNNYSYDRDRLSSITHNGFSYAFGYDAFGNTTNVKVGSQSLITNTYDANGGNLLLSTYGNGQTIGYTYDDKDRVTQKPSGGAVQARYVYDSNGNLAKTSDLVNGITWTNTYDLINQLTRVDGSNGQSILLGRDNKNRVNTVTNTIGGVSRALEYIYGDVSKSGQQAGLMYGVKLSGTQVLSYAYDALARLTTRTLSGAGNYNTNYTYIPGNAPGSTTTLLASVQNGSNSALQYTYDDRGNIKTISEGGALKVTYSYDALNQLTREDIYQTKSIGYTYDAGGNLLYKREYAYTKPGDALGTPTSTVSYSYTDANWKDKLTSYNGLPIDYDKIGNPTNYMNTWSFTWQNGRQLATATNTSAGKSLSFKYNDNGIRTQKTVNGLTTNYYLNGDSVVGERTDSTQSTGGTASDNGESNPVGEEEANAFDGNSATKWLIYKSAGAIQYTFNSGASKAVNCYTVTSANDAPERDPKNWTLQGSQNGTDWTTLDTQSNIQFSSRFETKKFYFLNSAAYKMYRLNITVNNGSTQYTQLADLGLYNNTDIDYYYDEKGDLFGFNYNDKDYYYIRSGQNDIIGIVDTSGNQVVSYTYDTWGKLLGTTGTLASTVGAANPYRYRGYRYDAETGLFYVSSRYYDPNTGRWLNADDTKTLADTTTELTDTNLFAYCGNNPVMRADEDGESWNTVLSVLAVVAIVAAVVAVGALVVATGGVGAVALAGAFSVSTGVVTGTAGTVALWSGATVVGLSAGLLGNAIMYKKNKPGQGRPELKKQGREGLEKKKTNPNYKGNPNKRPRTQPRHHTPGKEHQKYPQG